MTEPVVSRPEPVMRAAPRAAALAVSAVLALVPPGAAPPPPTGAGADRGGAVVGRSLARNPTTGFTDAGQRQGGPSAAVRRDTGGTVRIGGAEYPDPLVGDNGDPITTAADWERQRRPELLAAFAEHVYGHTLPEPADISFDAQPTSTSGDGGGAAKTVGIEVTGPEGSATFTLRLFTPTGRSAKGTFLLIDHRGSVADDPASSSGYAPVSQILEAGYAFAALDAEQVAPDEAGSYRSGVIDAFYPADQELPDDAGRTISAWAWGASRAMDYLQTDPDIDPARVAVIGHSRGGKAALWAGAQDPRFPVVISNNSGAAGAKLARRDESGESIAAINSQFPHWFPETYKEYSGNADSLPVDQHALLALVAPGRVVVGSASADGNADPEGEFLSYQAAARVYELYGLGDTGLTSPSWPPPENEAFRGPGMSYHLRGGEHGLTDADWATYLQGEVFSR